MEETAEWLSYGCKLAKHLEENLPNLVNQPDILLESCNNIIRVFSMCKELLSSGNIQIQVQPQELLQQPLDHGQEWLRTERTSNSGRELTDLLDAMAALDDRGLENVRMDGVAMQSSVKNLVNSSSQRRGRRKNECDTIVKRIPAPHMGNLDLPSEDGYTWRKYGQKEILGSTYQRSYYRCTDHKLYQCPAKKHVQRLNHDPCMFEVTYRRNHTCNVSVGASSSTGTVPLPEQSPTITISPVHPLTTSSFPPTHHCLSMKFFHELEGLSAAGSSNNSAFVAARSFSEYFLPVADMADVMFNSGSTSNNSMDFFFPTTDDKWDSDEKKEC